MKNIKIHLKRLLKSVLAVFFMTGITASSTVSRIYAMYSDEDENSINQIYSESKDISEVSGCDWMSALPDCANLADLNLPASHDSAAASIMFMNMNAFVNLSLGLVNPFKQARFREVIEDCMIREVHLNGPGQCGSDYISLAPFAQTQYLSIPDQLDAGIRVLDLRLSDYEMNSDIEDWSTLCLSHGGIPCRDRSGQIAGPYRFTDVMEQVKTFLADYPTETVILSLQAEGLLVNKSADSRSTYSGYSHGKYYMSDVSHEGNLGRIGERAKEKIKHLKAFYENNPEVILHSSSMEAYPDLKEARGKIILTGSDDLTTEDLKVVTGSWKLSSFEKWDQISSFLTQVNNDGANIQQYGQLKRLNPAFVQTNCTGSNTDYITGGLNAFMGQNPSLANNYLYKIVQFLAPGAWQKWLPEGTTEYISAADQTAQQINPKLFDFCFEKGRQYGWISMDFVNPLLAKLVYETNLSASDSPSFVSNLQDTYALRQKKADLEESVSRLQEDVEAFPGLYANEQEYYDLINKVERSGEEYEELTGMDLSMMTVEFRQDFNALLQRYMELIRLGKMRLTECNRDWEWIPEETDLQ